jgi:hypothetical protein
LGVELVLLGQLGSDEAAVQLFLRHSAVYKYSLWSIRCFPYGDLTGQRLSGEAKRRPAAAPWLCIILFPIDNMAVLRNLYPSTVFSVAEVSL